MATDVELGTYILPDDHKVWKFFPGKSYKFHDLVWRTSIALIDVRGLSELGRNPAKWTDEALLTHIAADRVQRRVEAGAKPPSRLVRSAGDKAILTFLRGLLFTAKKGDLILMPDKGYTTLVQVGIFEDEPGKLESVRAKDDKGTHRYYGRKVQWIGEIEKRKLGDNLINLLHSRAAFFDVGRANYEEVYSKAFDDYVYDGQYVATFRTSKLVFTSKDSLLSSLWFELIEVLDGASTANTQLAIDDIYELAVESNIAEDDRNDLSIYVQSPGWWRWRSLTVEPLVAAALFAMAVGSVPFDEAKAATVTAQVVRQADVQCLGVIDQTVKDYLNLLGAKRWEQACKLAGKAHTQATLNAHATLKNPPKRAIHRK